MKISTKFILVIFIVSIWIHCFEALKHWLLVMPEMRSYLSSLGSFALINTKTLIIWSLLSTMLAGLVTWATYLTSEKYGYRLRTYIQAGTVSMLFTFLLFWSNLANMNLARWEFVPVVLVFCLIETIAASVIAGTLIKKYFSFD